MLQLVKSYYDSWVIFLCLPFYSLSRDKWSVGTITIVFPHPLVLSQVLKANFSIPTFIYSILGLVSLYYLCLSQDTSPSWWSSSPLMLDHSQQSLTYFHSVILSLSLLGSLLQDTLHSLCLQRMRVLSPLFLLDSGEEGNFRKPLGNKLHPSSQCILSLTASGFVGYYSSRDNIAWVGLRCWGEGSRTPQNYDLSSLLTLYLVLKHWA